MATILIVEDEPLIRMTLADALLDDGHRVLECGNVLEAIAALGTEDDVAAVVTDVDMPGGLSGLDLARFLASTRPHIPLWVASGRDIDPAALVSAATFLKKPYDLGALVQTVTTATDCGRPTFGTARSLG